MLPEYLTIFAVGLLPSIIWLVFFERTERERPERVTDLAFAFFVGVLSTFAALFFQIGVAKYFATVGIDNHSGIGVSVFAAIEELLKFSGVFFIVARRKSFTEPLDAMIYMITAAVGFAAVENIALLINTGAATTILQDIKTLEILVLRFLGATLLHAGASGIIGFHWAVGWVRGKMLWVHILVGIIISSLLHGAFNILVLKYGPASWALLFVAAIAFFLLIDFEELRTEEERDGFVTK
jgi:RsiW-degrading membrane proteinase PrsW (M82 family)